MANHPMSAIEWSLNDAREARDIWNKTVLENKYNLPSQDLWRSPDYQTYSKYADQVHDLLGIRRDKQRGLLPTPTDDEWSAKLQREQQTKSKNGEEPMKNSFVQKGSAKDKRALLPGRQAQGPLADQLDDEGELQPEASASLADTDKQRQIRMTTAGDVMSNGRANERALNARQHERATEHRPKRNERPFPFSVYPNEAGIAKE